MADRYPRASLRLATKLHNTSFHSLAERDRVCSEQLLKAREPDISVAFWVTQWLFSGMSSLEQQDNLVIHAGFQTTDHQVAPIISRQIAVPCIGGSY